MEIALEWVAYPKLRLHGKTTPLKCLPHFRGVMITTQVERLVARDLTMCFVYHAHKRLGRLSTSGAVNGIQVHIERAV